MKSNPRKSGGKRGGGRPRATKPPALKRDPLVDALAGILTPARDMGGLVKRLAVSGEEVDYQVERMIEQITSAIENRGARLQAALKAANATLDQLGHALRTTWLEGDFPRCGVEVKVRAAEALGAWSIAMREGRAAVVRRLSSEHFEHRMWAARAVRASGWPDATSLLAKLRDDPYTDDNGFYLVREAAGFED